MTRGIDSPANITAPSPMHLIQPLHTPRLTIREISAADLLDLQAVNGDPEVTRFLPYATWKSEEDAQAWLARMQALAESGSGRQFVIALNTSGRVIGTILLFRFDAGSSRAELGYVLGRAHWRQGMMEEALRAFCGHLFTTEGIRRLEAEVDPANEPSNALLTRIGFVREGMLRKRWVAKGGEPYDTNIYGALAEEWR